MNKNYLFGIGIVLVMLLAFAAPAAADNVVYFDPDPSCVAPGEEIIVTMWLDNTDGVQTFSNDVHFDPEVVNITSGAVGDLPTMFGAVHYGTYMRVGGISPDWLNVPPGHYVLVNFTVKGVGPGTSDLHHNLYELSNEYGHTLQSTWIDGTSYCEGLPTTFTKSLALGWNLISLPLTPTDSSTSAVLGNATITYDVVYRYDATSKEFVDVTTGTMDTGIGYFVNVMTAGIWEYEGTPETSTSTELKTGLNMIGVPNCTMSVDYAMGSVDYRYVARWDAADQEFEVYNPSAPVAFWHFDTMEPGEGYFVSAKSDYISPPWEINCPS